MANNEVIATMQRAIVDYIKSNMPKDRNHAVSGVIMGDRVVIGNKSYPYVPTVDVYFGEGDYVYCILPDAGTVAAVVGVV